MLRIGVRIEKSHAGLIRERRPVRFSSGKVGYAYRWIKPDSVRGAASEDRDDQMGLFDTSRVEPWTMTYSEIEQAEKKETNHRERKRLREMLGNHRAAVADAVAAGKPVPQKVIESYPSLDAMYQPLNFGIASQEPVTEFEHNGVEFKALGRRIPNIGGDERQVILYRKSEKRDIPLGVFMVPEYQESPNPAWVVKELLASKNSAVPEIKAEMERSGAPTLPAVIPSTVGSAWDRASQEMRTTIKIRVENAYDRGLDSAASGARADASMASRGRAKPSEVNAKRKLSKLFEHAAKPGPLNTVFFGVGEPRDENGASVFELPEKALAMAIRQKWDEGDEPVEAYLDRVDRVIRKRVLGES